MERYLRVLDDSVYKKLFLDYTKSKKELKGALDVFIKSRDLNLRACGVCNNEVYVGVNNSEDAYEEYLKKNLLGKVRVLNKKNNISKSFFYSLVSRGVNIVPKPSLRNYIKCSNRTKFYTLLKDDSLYVKVVSKSDIKYNKKIFLEISFEEYYSLLR